MTEDRAYAPRGKGKTRALFSLTTFVPEDVFAWARLEARARGVTMSFFLRDLLERVRHEEKAP